MYRMFMQSCTYCLIFIFEENCARKAFITTLHSDDHSRVVLSVPDEDGSDYINASFIDVSVLCMYTTSYIQREVHVDV